ncbi:hypothetical protein GCM10025787_02630 [Saccharopolyspora rosea]
MRTRELSCWWPTDVPAPVCSVRVFTPCGTAVPEAVIRMLERTSTLISLVFFAVVP